MFGFFRKRRAIKSFIRQVGPALERRHGRKLHYTPDEVRGAAAETHNLNQWVPYACAIYCTQQAFAADPQLAAGEYGAMREEVAKSHFGGDSSFDAPRAIDAAEPATSSGGGDSGGDYGGDSGGDGGGGGD